MSEFRLVLRAVYFAPCPNWEAVLEGRARPLVGPVLPVEVARVQDSTLDDLYRILDCDLVDCVVVDQRVRADLWVDDEGLMRDRPVLNRRFSFVAHDGTTVPNWYEVFGGAVLLGVDAGGRCRTPTLDEAMAVVRLAELAVGQTPESLEHPLRQWLEYGLPWVPLR